MTQNLTVGACRELSLTVTAGAEWLTALPGLPQGGKSAVSLNANPAALEPGDYSAAVTISDPDAWFGPSTVRVTLSVVPPPPPLESRN